MQNQPVDRNGHFEGQNGNGDDADGLFEKTRHRQRGPGIDGDCSFARRCGDYHSPEIKGGAMEKTSWEKLEGEQLNKLISRQMLSGDNATVARLLMTRGAVVPRHSHVSEQFSLILSGALKFVFDDREVVVRGGEVLYIPANEPHSAVALEDTVDIDFFAPRREDWIRREDAYLREQRV
jgi:quercetin dioxygenase-like cupin family protein